MVGLGLRGGVKSGDVGPLQSPGCRDTAAIADRKHVSSRTASKPAPTSGDVLYCTVLRSLYCTRCTVLYCRVE